MRFLTLKEVLQVHDRVIRHTGGARGMLDLGLLESALGQCRMAFGGQETYPSLAEKAAIEIVLRGHPLKGPLSREKAPLLQGKNSFLAEGTDVLRTASASACSSPLPVFLSGGVGSFPHRTSHPSGSRRGPLKVLPLPLTRGPENLRFHAASKRVGQI